MLQVTTNSIERMLQSAADCERAAQLPEAERIYGQVLALNPLCAEALLNLGNCLRARGGFAEAIDCYQRALALRAEWPNALSNMGIALAQLRRLPEGIACWRRAVAAAPDFAEAYNNLGNGLNEEGRSEEAIEAYRRAMALRPGWVMALNNLVAALHAGDRAEEALGFAERAVGLDGNCALHHNNLGLILKDLGEIERAVVHLRRAVELDPADVRAHQNLLYTLHYDAGTDSERLYREHILWDERHARHLSSGVPHRNETATERRLRIGYISPDFRHHPVSHFLLPLLQKHDRTHFEIVCYSDVRRPDGMTEQIRKCTDLWRDITEQTDEQVSEIVRGDGVDVLVDLTMHMAGSRLLIFARKPAPVQVTWLGYPGTTGLSAMDYRLSDRHLDPPGASAACYSEETMRLPASYWCYDPLTAVPHAKDPPAKRNGFVTFGCLSNICKVTEGTLRLWGEILRRVDDSRLLMIVPELRTQEWIRNVLASEGVARERLELIGRRPRGEYLKLYDSLDIVLDTVPYNGHTTSLDAAWMGVPVVTLEGETAVGRGGASILATLGMGELVAKRREEYVRIAAELAGDWGRLGDLRGTLRSRLQASPLMNAADFARAMEEAYRLMWRRWCRK